MSKRKSQPENDLEPPVEEENLDEQPTTGQPWDPSQIRVDPKVFSLRQIMDMIDEKDLDLAPEFQRHQVWKLPQKVQLIESILLRIPIGAFYFSTDKAGRMSVVDGVQRLSTIYQFMRGTGKGTSTPALENRKQLELVEKEGYTFPLVSEDLEYLRTEVGGKPFEGLDPIWKRRISQTQISVNIIDALKHPLI